MPTLLKDYYDRPFVTRLAEAVAAESPGFDVRAFTRAVLAAPWPDLALKQRMRRITTVLGDRLPGAYPRQLSVLERIASRFTGLTAPRLPRLRGGVRARRPRTLAARAGAHDALLHG